MSDLVRVIEAAYDLTATDATWLARIAEAARADFGFADGVIACSYDVRENGWIAPRDVIVSGAAPEVASQLLDARTFPPMISGVDLATRIGARARGFADALTIHTSEGCLFLVPMRNAPRLAPRVAHRYALLAAHVAAGLRLRRALGTAARDSLRAAVRAVERARGKRGKRDSAAALEVWRGLVAGRASLVDRFEADGRQFIVAHPNPPDADDPRALTRRERQVASRVSLGQSNKTIAYELGISPSTVGVLVARAAKKLGVKSRAALAAAFMPRPARERLKS